MKLYLAGPRREIDHFNFPAFRVAAYELRRQGHDVFSPAERDEEIYGVDFSDTDGKDFDLRSALAADCKYICEEADGIYMLKGWEKSYGARAEHALAVALGLYVEYQ